MTKSKICLKIAEIEYVPIETHAHEEFHLKTAKKTQSFHITP